MARRPRWHALLVLVAGILVVTPSPAGDSRTESFRRDGFAVTLTPLTYDQVASFYLARGLPRSEVERYARTCVLALALRNDRPEGAISFRSGEWVARTSDGAPQPVRARLDWLQEFENTGVPQAARIAFEWAQVPDRHEFEPGDWIQGMLAVPVARDTAFDLKLRWRAEGSDHEHWATGLRCP